MDVNALARFTRTFLYGQFIRQYPFILSLSQDGRILTDERMGRVYAVAAPCYHHPASSCASSVLPPSSTIAAIA